MSDVIKRGRLEVKKKNLFGSAYKNRCVLLRNSLALNCKTVEILEGEDETEDCKDVIKLNDVWTVQDKPSRNKGRFTFELVKGDEVILTFACGSVMEREEWMESFRILNQLALPCETGQQLSNPITDYFQVTLLKNRNAVEINHSGSYLLSITDTAIVLHWKTGAIAHHWPKRGVVKFLHHPKKEGHLILHAKKSGTEDVVDFEFTMSPENSMQILKTWNIRLMESITFNPQQLNEISSVLNTGTLPSDGKHKKGRGNVSRSFRTSKHNSIKVEHQQELRRADTFSKLQGYRTDINGRGGALPGGLSQVSVRVGGLPPLPREANTRSWGGDDHLGPNGFLGTLSQDSVFAHSIGLLGSPPPLPPRPNFRTKDNGNQDDSDDPDYAYIKEDEVEGPSNAASIGTGSNGANKHRPSISMDDVLSRLEHDIIRDNRAKKEGGQRKKTMTLDRAPTGSHKHMPLLSLGPRIQFSQPQPQDYTDFVPTKRSPNKSTSSEPEKTNILISHERSTSEPDSRICPSTSRIGIQPPAVFESTDEVMDSLQPRSDHTPSDYSDFLPSTISAAPSLPPRSWRNASASSYNSLSSGNDLSESVSSAVFAPISEAVVASSGKGVTFTCDTLNDRSKPDKPVSLELLDKKPVRQTTPSDKENKAPPTTIPEETLPTEVPQPEGPGTTATPPPLPPRSPTKEKLSRKSSTSSTSSASSTGRCPRCRSQRRSKASVSKTVSLDQRTAAIAKEAQGDYRKSLPDLADKFVPENNLGGKGHRHTHRSREHSHCSKCSPVSSTDALQGDNTPSLKSTSLQNFDYLQLVGEDRDTTNSSSSIEDELGAEMDLLNSCLQTLEYLENKAKEPSNGGGGTDTMTSRVSNTTVNHIPSTARGATLESKVNHTPSTVSHGMTSGSKVNHTPPTVSRSMTSGSKVSHTPSTVSRGMTSGSKVSYTPSTMSHGMTTGSKVKPADVMKSVYTQAKNQAELVLAELNQPLRSQVAAARVSSYGAERHSAQLSKQSSFTPSTIASKGHPNGTLPVRSASSTMLVSPTIGHTPPIPPRSMVSLTETLAIDPKSTSSLRASPKNHSASQLQSQAPPTNKYNRSVSGGSQYPPHHPPVRSATSLGINTTPTFSSRGHPSRHQNHVEAPGQSSTVFIHHLKDRRVGGLTHLV